MSDGIYVALSGAVAQQRSLDVVANNVANASTIGYHGDRVAFRQALAQAGTQGPAPDTLRFNLVAQTITNHDTGSLQQTGNPLDVALQGDAWFVLRTPAGERYTRSGAFVTDRDGVLRSKDGHPVLGRPLSPNGPRPEIIIPQDATEIQITRDGEIFAIGPNAPADAGGDAVGQLFLTQFDENTTLRKAGDTIYSAEGGRPIDALQYNDLIQNDGTAPAQIPVEALQGYVEKSNINPIAGMNELIKATRSFEAFQSVIDTYEQIDGRAARDLGARSA